MITIGNYTNFGRRYVADGCTGKQGFASYGEAETEIGNLIRKGAHREHHGTLAPYHCGYCHQFHLGHHKTREQVGA